MPLPPFQRLVDEHRRDVSGLAHALVGPHDGDDVAQQAWTQAYAAYPSLRSSSNLRAWLLTVTYRCAMDLHRARARHPVPMDAQAALDAPQRAGPPADESLPDDALWRRVAALPQRQRHAVALRYLADLDHARIAEALGTTATASRRLVSDALATLRKELS